MGGGGDEAGPNKSLYEVLCNAHTKKTDVLWGLLFLNTLSLFLCRLTLVPLGGCPVHELGTMIYALHLPTLSQGPQWQLQHMLITRQLLEGHNGCPAENRTQPSFKRSVRDMVGSMKLEQTTPGS